MKIKLLLLALIAATPSFSDHALKDRDIALGKKLYTEQCASCHGANLQGQPNWRIQNDDGTLPAPPHDAQGHTWHHGTEMLFTYTKIGGAKYLEDQGISGFKSAMPAFEGTLTGEEILDILGFIRSTWPKEIQAAQAQRSAH